MKTAGYGVVVAFALLGVYALGAGIWHAVDDHRNLHAAIVWVAQMQQAQQRQAQQRQQATQAGPVKPVPPPAEPEK